MEKPYRRKIQESDRGSRRTLDPKYKIWRAQVFERDNYTCKITGATGNFGKLCAHHIESWNNNPNLRFKVNNGLTMLVEVHEIFHNIYGRGFNNQSQLEEFIQKYHSLKLNKQIIL